MSGYQSFLHRLNEMLDIYVSEPPPTSSSTSSADTQDYYSSRIISNSIPQDTVIDSRLVASDCETHLNSILERG